MACLSSPLNSVESGMLMIALKEHGGLAIWAGFKSSCIRSGMFLCCIIIILGPFWHLLFLACDLFLRDSFEQWEAFYDESSGSCSN